MLAYVHHSHGWGYPWWVSLLIVGGMAAYGYYIRRARTKANRVESTGNPSAFFSKPGDAPGWYPDPNDVQMWRYFDGQSWTTNTAPRQSG